MDDLHDARGGSSIGRCAVAATFAFSDGAIETRNSDGDDFDLANSLRRVNALDAGAALDGHIHDDVVLVLIEPNTTTERSRPMSVTAFQDLPMADRDREWEGDAAEKRVREWAGAADGPNEKYRDAHVWYDHEKKQNFGAYKLLIADVINGKLHAVPRAVMAAGAVMQGSRGGIDLPESDIDRVKSHLGKYYAKMDDTPPWDRD
jgi:hypothetical protein